MLKMGRSHNKNVVALSSIIVIANRKKQAYIEPIKRV